MPLIMITPPAVEPVTAADLAIPARLDSSEFDTHIDNVLVPTFRAEAEHRLGRRLITQTVELVLDCFPVYQDVDLLLPNVQNIVSVKYLDVSGAQQVVDAGTYLLDGSSTPCWLIPVSAWPATGNYANAVRIRYVVGYGPSGNDVPPNVRTWIIAHVIQALDNPCGLDQNIKTLPYIDRLLDAETVLRAI